MRPSRLLALARYRRQQRRLAAPRILRAFAASYPEAVFVEVGSNDGEKHDHLHDFIRSNPWRGVMVEPVPFVFRRLQQNYGDLDRVRLENVALSSSDGTRDFFHLREARDEELERLPEWYDGIGSFSREVVLKHAPQIPDLEQRLVKTSVRCETFDTLVRRVELERIDLLVIDVEGHDWELLRHIDIAVHRPRLVVFEHYHLTAVERDESRDRFRALGYELLEEGFDTFCMDPLPDSLTQSWRGLKPAVAAVAEYEQR